MKKKIALFLACVMALSSLFAVSASAANYSDDTKTCQTVEALQTPQETDWQDNPFDTGHCCIDDSQPYTEGGTNHCVDWQYAYGPSDPSESAQAAPVQGSTNHCTDWDTQQNTDPTESCVTEPTESVTTRPAWMDDPYDTGHCVVDPSASMPTESYDDHSDIQGDTNHCCEYPYPSQQHHYSDNEDETCFCGEHHPLTDASETESSTTLPAWMDENPDETGHCVIDPSASMPTETYDDHSDIQGDTSHCEDTYPLPHHYSDVEDETCFCGEHHPLTVPSEPESSRPTDSEETSEEMVYTSTPVETETAPETTQPEKELTPLEKFKAHLAEKFNMEVEVDLFEKLSANYYLVHYNLNTVNPLLLRKCVDKYIYSTDGSEKDVFIYSVKKNAEYEVCAAYENGLISKTTLKKISRALASGDFAKLSLNTYTVKAGETAYNFLLTADFAKGKIKNTNSKVAKVVKNGEFVEVVGLKKGTAVLSRKIKGGKQISCTVNVTTNPELTKDGKSVSAVSVKKGKTVTVKITGKADSFNNKYYNTSKARVISKKSVDKIKIKGLKKGATTLRIKVNGVILRLKVNVK